MNWLDTVRLELDNIDEKELGDDVFEGDPVKRNERVVGVAPLDLRKIIFLSRNYAKQAAQMALDAMFANKTATEEDTRILNKLKIESEEIKDLFWVCCRQEFDLWGHKLIGIRQGWKIVAVENGDDSEVQVEVKDISELVKRMLKGLS